MKEKFSVVFRVITSVVAFLMLTSVMLLQPVLVNFIVRSLHEGIISAWENAWYVFEQTTSAVQVMATALVTFPVFFIIKVVVCMMKKTRRSKR